MKISSFSLITNSSVYKSSRERKNTTTKEKPSKKNLPKLHEISPFLPLRNSNNAGKWYRCVKRHGCTVSFWLCSTVVPPGTRRLCQISVSLPKFASRGTACSCVWPHLLRVWVGFSLKIIFGLLFGLIFILPTKHSIKLISLN